MMLHSRDDNRFDIVLGRSRSWKFRLPRWPHLALRLIGSSALLLICLTALATRATASLPGVWLMGSEVAIQMFDCTGLLCGRVIWLKVPLDAQGLLKRDNKNPDPALRQRQVCGPTIIWNLHPKGPNRWEGGWFYNPNDGKTYRTYMEFKSADVIVARIYSGFSIFGESKTLVRVPQGTSEGWC